ncbi:MAG: nucleotidyltransferase domain-containing protein [Acidobacteriota bacterium]|nr:nucleotidyltransferase domain-containing protein [Acidobacteriota bacterium]
MRYFTDRERRLWLTLTLNFHPRLRSLNHGLFLSACVTGVARLEAFGSVARGEPHRGSDIDLLISFPPEVRLGWDFFELQKELENLLGCQVDLLTRRSVEQDRNSIRRRSILASTCEVYST